MVKFGASPSSRKGRAGPRPASVLRLRIGAPGTRPDTAPLQAALALAEHVTRLSDRSDAVWDAAAEHYGEEALAALVISLPGVNAWNRLNVEVAQPTGEYRG